MRCLFIGRDGFTSWREVPDDYPPRIMIPHLPRVLAMPFPGEMPRAAAYETREFLANQYVSEPGGRFAVVYVEDGHVSDESSIIMRELEVDRVLSISRWAAQQHKLELLADDAKKVLDQRGGEW